MWKTFKASLVLMAITESSSLYFSFLLSPSTNCVRRMYRFVGNRNNKLHLTSWKITWYWASTGLFQFQALSKIFHTWYWCKPLPRTRAVLSCSNRMVLSGWLLIVVFLEWTWKKLDILNSASRILPCWSYYVKSNPARHQHDTKRTSWG